MKVALVSLATAKGKERKRRVATRNRIDGEKNGEPARGGRSRTVAARWSRRDVPIPSMVETSKMVAKDSWTTTPMWRCAMTSRYVNQGGRRHADIGKGKDG